MKDQELFDLCKEVYKRTEWDDTEYFYYMKLAYHLWNVQKGPIDRFTFEGSDPCEFVPLYTSDYLLEKLPPFIEYEEKTPHLLTLQPNPLGRGWQALYRFSLATPTTARNHAVEIHTADTSLKALLKLVIALHEAGDVS